VDLLPDEAGMVRADRDAARKLMKKRLLIAELHHLGDAVLSLPYVRGAAEKYEITILCRPSVAPIFRACPVEVDILAWDPPWHEETQLEGGMAGFWSALGLIRKLRAWKFDVAASVWPDPRVHALFRAGGAKERIGLSPTDINFYGAHLPWRRKTLEKGASLSAWINRTPAGPLLTTSLERSATRAHHLDGWQKIADASGTELDLTFPWLAAEDVRLDQRVAKFLEYHRLARRPVWLMHPGARTAVRRWSGFQELLDRVFGEDAGVAALAVRPPGEPGLTVSGPNQIEVAPRSLEELIAFTAAVEGVICNDSLQSHLGAALGKKVAAVFGPMTPDWFAPYDNRAGVIEAPVCPHRPCLDRCVMPSPICIESVTVEMAERVVRNLMN
jgi:ADP-heptose:LPS heptosyltransferase